MNPELFAAAIRMATPLILASIGGIYSERSGIVNIALEGIMLTGAYGSAVGAYYANNAWVGLCTGIIAGMLIAFVHAVICITFQSDQIISGVAINLLAVGATEFGCFLTFGTPATSARVEGFTAWRIPLIADIPYLGKAIGSFSPIVYLTSLILIFSHVLLFKTAFGLRLRATGESFEAVKALGLNPSKLRYIGVTLSGVLAAMGGSFLVLETHYFAKEMTAGRGYIALAAVIFGRWKPYGAAGACLLFGFASALESEFVRWQIPSQFIKILPYLLTMVVLAGAIGKAIPPACLGKRD